MRRRVGLFLFCGLVVPLLVASNAAAQGATLELIPNSGPAGTEVAAKGFSFSGSNANIEGPKIRFSTRDAPVLKGPVIVEQDNTFSTTFVVPEVPPGEYLVLATQYSVRGRSTSGPGRAKFRVTAGSSAAAGAATAASASSGSGTSQAVVAVGALMVGLVLLAGGTLAVVRRRIPHHPLSS